MYHWVTTWLKILLQPLPGQSSIANFWFSYLSKMDSHIFRAFQKELTCLICLTYFTDPVTIHCGHSFCRPCLYLSWEEAETPAKCPTCRETSQNTDLKTSIILKNLVSYIRQEHLHQFVSSEEHLCRTHKETRKIFCEENENLLCLLCSKSHEHETHNHSSIERAAEDYRVSDASESTLRGGNTIAKT